MKVLLFKEFKEIKRLADLPISNLRGHMHDTRSQHDANISFRHMSRGELIVAVLMDSSDQTLHERCCEFCGHEL